MFLPSVRCQCKKLHKLKLHSSNKKNYSGNGILSAVETLLFSRFDSPIGVLLLGASPAGLVLIEFARDARQPSIKAVTRDAQGMKIRIAWEPSATATRPYEKELSEYFAGRRREFSFPLDLRGTDFQKRCWRALIEIPYGETRNYRDIARRVGTTGYRAVGMANHTNPLPIVVPCHRVIASNGTLCGYGGGLDIKRHLLHLEGAAFREAA
jgi:methylated-DNA-[protein]-cysteine S-methyltransferase